MLTVRGGGSSTPTRQPRWGARVHLPDCEIPQGSHSHYREFSHSLYRKVVLTSWDRGMCDCERDPPTTETVWKPKSHPREWLDCSDPCLQKSHSAAWRNTSNFSVLRFNTFPAREALL